MIELPLTNRGVVVIDDDSPVLAHRWHWDGRYAVRFVGSSRKPGRCKIYLHRAVMGEVPTGLDVDHINGDTRDCRRGNLRAVDRSTNSSNRHKASGRSGLVGVAWDERNRRWMAKVQWRRRSIWLGRFDTAEEARAAYVAAQRALGIGRFNPTDKGDRR